MTRTKFSMKPKGLFGHLFFSVIAVGLLGSECFLAAQNSAIPPKGPGKIVVRPKFGGPVSGYDIDQNGTEGVLTEFKP